MPHRPYQASGEGKSFRKWQDTGYNEKKNHDNPMKGKKLVVYFSIYDISARPDQFEPHNEPQRYCHQKKGGNGIKVKHCDPLVVYREYPTEQALSGLVKTYGLRF
jgi:hypothetical protein